MAGPQPIEIRFTPENIARIERALLVDDLDDFRMYFEDDLNPIGPDDTLDEVPLLFIATGSRKRDRHYSPRITRYLLEHGADMDAEALNMKAEEYSAIYYRDIEFDRVLGQYVPVEDHVMTSVVANLAVMGNIDGLKLFDEFGAYFAEDDEFIESPLRLAENKLLQLDADIEGIRQDEEAYWLGNIHEHTKERVKIARTLKWLRYITTEENVKKAHYSHKNIARFERVLKGAPVFGSNLERKAFMNFLKKPAMFTMGPKINTSLFEGGTRRRRKSATTRKQKLNRLRKK